MSKLYTTLLSGAFLLLTASIHAQSTDKTNPQAIRPLMAHPASAGHTGTSDLRGGLPTNDGCGSVTPQALAIGGSLTFTGDNTGATMTGDYEPGSELEGAGLPSVWHAFTTTACADVTISYCNSPTAFAANFWIIISTACPAGDNSLVFNTGYDLTTCANGNGTVFFDMLPAGTYYVPVLMDEVEGVVGSYSINVTATACPAPPANDACASAITLVSSASCNPVPFSTLGATQALAPISCGGFTSPNAMDVFFSFVCTNATQTIGVVGLNEADAVVELFSGSCGSLVSLDCADATYPTAPGQATTEELTRSGLTVGTTYYVRVYDYAHASDEHEFEICVVEGSGTNVGIAEYADGAEWGIYPNPGSGIFTVRYDGLNAIADIEVLDLTGRLVRIERVALNTGTNHAMDLGTVAAGNYMVRLTVDGVRTTRQLIVE